MDDQESVRRRALAMNRSFYGAAPYNYFRQRLTNIVLTAAAPNRLASLVSEGVALGEVTAYFMDDSESPLLDSHARDGYLALEATNLLHHCAETLLRLHLAHESLSICPWFEVANLTRFWEFRQMVRERFREGIRDNSDMARLCQVYFLVDDPGKITFAESGMAPSLDNINAYLTYFAGLILDEASVYNSSKHGFAIRSQDVAFEMVDVFKKSGPAVICLERQEDKTWRRVVRWVDVEQHLKLIEVACLLMEQLWLIAKARYLGEIPEQLNPFGEPTLKSILFATGPEQIHIMRLPVLFGPEADEGYVP